MFLIGIGLFLVLSFLLAIPGNKKLRTVAVENKVKSEIKKNRRAAVKVSLTVLLILILIVMIMNLSILR
jgi:archaellum biogenesis protein FlaJ (TadC family)